MKKTLILSLLIITIVLFIYWLLVKNNKYEQHVYVTHDVLVHQIEQLGNLEVVKYNIQDMMEYEKVRTWLPNSKAHLKVVGEVVACVDLTKLEQSDIYVMKDSVSLLLPTPQICHYKIDHSRSQVYNIEYGLWESAQLVDQAYQHAEQNLYQEALKMGIAKESRENTIKVLTPILRSLGFKRIQIGFKSPQQSIATEQKLSISNSEPLK